MGSVRILENGQIAIYVPKDADDFVVDNAMQYLIYKVPNYKNWCNDRILGNSDKLTKYLATYSADNDYKTGGQKLPEGQWVFVTTTDNLGLDQKTRMIILKKIP